MKPKRKIFHVPLTEKQCSLLKKVEEEWKRELTEEQLAILKDAEERLEREGVSPLPPRKLSDCRTLADLCRYVFKSVEVDGDCQMLFDGPHVIRWVWCGHEFTDKHVGMVEKAVTVVNDAQQLKELRLVATRVSGSGIEKLKRCFSGAKVTVYTDQDDDQNWELSQAYYTRE